MQIKRFFHGLTHFKKYFSKKYRVQWIVAVIIIGIAAFVFFKNGDKTETLVVHPGEFLQQVAVSGKIVATEIIDLSFEQSGQVRGVYVKEGDAIKISQLLSSQDTLQLSAQLAETEAGITLQEAKLNQLLAGSSAEDIRISESKVQLAQQDLDNSYENSLTVLDSAYTAISNSNNTVAYIRNTYFSASDQQGVKVQNEKNKIQDSLNNAKNYLDQAKLNPTDSAINSAIENIISYLNDVYQSLDIIRAQCEEGAYYSKVSSTDKSSLDTQKTNINTALNNVKSSKQDILGYKISLQQAENELALVKAPARESDIAVYQAQISQAKASSQNILAQIRKKQIYSPIAGTVTKVDIKIGSIASGGQKAISIISSDPFLIESYIPEIYVPLVNVGDKALITLDAYGPDVFFQAQVVSIDPAETLKESVATYRSKLQFLEKDSRVKSGMTSNVLITTEKKDNVISVPQGIVIIKNGKKFVKVQSGSEIVEKEVQTGIISSLGQIEVISGLQDGDIVIIK